MNFIDTEENQVIIREIDSAGNLIEVIFLKFLNFLFSYLIFKVYGNEWCKG